MKLCFLTFLWLGPRNVGLFKDEKIRSQTLELNSHYQPTICSKRNSGGWSQQQRRDIKNRRRVGRIQNPGWRMGCIQPVLAKIKTSEIIYRDQFPDADFCSLHALHHLIRPVVMPFGNHALIRETGRVWTSFGIISFWFPYTIKFTGWLNSACRNICSPERNRLFVRMTAPILQWCMAYTSSSWYLCNFEVVPRDSAWAWA